MRCYATVWQCAAPRNNDAVNAAEHLRAAVRHDPQYFAAWKLLGHALESTSGTETAAVADARGDQQVVKEMAAFLKCLAKCGTSAA